MKKQFVYISCIFSFVSTSMHANASAQETSCSPVTEKEIANLFDKWNASLTSKDAKAVSRHYADDAVLLPTLSNRSRTTPAAIGDYFAEFLEKSPKSTILSRKITLACNTAYDVGTYKFHLIDKNSHLASDITARYSFIYSYRNGKWLITHHHSSLMPEKEEPALSQK